MKKYARILSVLLPVTLATGAVFLARRFEQSHFHPSGVSGMPGKAIPSFRPAEVRSIEFRFRSVEPLTLVLKDGRWLIRRNGHPDAPAAAGKIATLLDRLADLSPVRELRAGTEKELGELALADYALAGPASGYRTVLRNGSGKVLLSVMFGAAHYRDPEQFGNYAMQQPDGRYLRVDASDKPGKYRVFLIPGVFEQCIPHAGTWLEHLRIASFEDPLLLRWSEHGKTIWEIRRDKNTQEYRLNIPENKRLSMAKTDRKIKLLTGPFTRDVAAASALFHPDSELMIECGNGFTYILEIQNSSRQMDRLAKLNIAFDGKKVLPRKGENTSALAQRKQFLARRASAEQSLFEGRTYILQPNVISIVSEEPGD